MLYFLLTLADESDHKKIEYIYNNYHEYMLKFAASKFRGYGRRNAFYDAEDAVQNAFVKITKYINNIDFNAKNKEIKNYVFAILINEIYNILNKNIEIDEIDEEYSENQEYDYIRELDVKERYNEIVEAIEHMDEKYSSTLFMLYCKEMTINEIAELMGISTKTVYTRVQRGKKLLLEQLGVKVDGKY